MSEDKTSIVSKVKTGLNSFKDLKLPIAEQSIAGFVAVHKKMINIRDVYDEKELKAYSPQLNFLKQVDVKTGYRTKQMLAAPVIDAQTKELIGVMQIINSKSGQPFPALMEEGATHVAETLAIAFRQRQKPVAGVKGKYDHLVSNAVISAEELELATRSARRKNLDVETVLIDEVVEEGAVARSKSDAPEIDGQVFIDNATHLKVGDFVDVELEEADDYDLWGRLV